MDESYPSWIETLTPKLYSFTYSLVPDELQSKQIVIDSITKVVMEESALIDFVSGSKELVKTRLYPKLFAQAFEIASKRAYQLDGLLIQNNEVESKHNHFYKKLDIQKRAISFLYTKLKFSVDMLMETFQLKRYEVAQLIHISRHELTQAIS
jgi:hypothetical protein